MEQQLVLWQVWEFSHGEDSRPVEVPGPRKSVGAQITYGVRLDSEADAEQFLERLAGAPTPGESDLMSPYLRQTYPPVIVCAQASVNS